MLTASVFYFVINLRSVKDEKSTSLSSISKFLISIFIFIFVFSLIYKDSGVIYRGDIVEPPVPWGIAVYFSMVTFTTLGYGDIQPVESVRFLAGLEAFLGYLSLGVLIGLILKR